MRKIFYGWWLLLGLFLIYSATNGIGLNTLPLFYNQLIQEFNWSESEVTRPASLLYLLVAIVSPFVGILLDRFKTKAIMVIGSFAIVGSLVLFSLINTLSQFTGVYLMYSLALTAAGIIPSMYLITKWFSKYRGIAVGIFLMGSSFGGAIFPQIAQYGFNQFEWRTAYLLLALSAAITVLLPVIFLIRNRPEDMNTYPDGQRPVQQNQVQGDTPPILKSVTLSEALKSPLFYLLTIVTASMWFCIVGVINHQTIFFGRDLNIEGATIANVVSVFFTASIVGKIIFGYLSDKFSKQNIMLLAALNLLAGTALLRFSVGFEEGFLFVYALTFGIGFSGAFTMIQLIVAELYAGPSYGKILGIVTFVDTLAGSLGIFVLGKMKELSGSYISAFNLLVVICIAAAIAVIFIKRQLKVKGVNA